MVATLTEEAQVATFQFLVTNTMTYLDDHMMTSTDLWHD